MRETFRGPLTAAAVALAGVIAVMLFIDLVLGAVGLVLLTAWASIVLSGDDVPSEPEFEAIVQRSEALAKQPPPDLPPDEFGEILTAAIDELPQEFRDALEKVPVVISYLGREHRAYGHYFGDGVARDDFPDRIVIYRDTLERDFGHDPDLLRAQIVQTLRHELAHHLGWSERGVRDLGL